MQLFQKALLGSCAMMILSAASTPAFAVLSDNALSLNALSYNTVTANALAINTLTVNALTTHVSSSNAASSPAADRSGTDGFAMRTALRKLGAQALVSPNP